MPNFKLIGGPADRVLIGIPTPLPEKVVLQLPEYSGQDDEGLGPERTDLVAIHDAVYTRRYLKGIPVFVHEDVLTDRKIIEILLTR